MKNILFLASRGGPNSHIKKLTSDLSSYIGKKGNTVSYDVYSNLEYTIINNKAKIFSAKNNQDIKVFDLVVLINWQRTPEQATVCGLYLKKHKTKIIYADFINFRSHTKLTEYFKFWYENLPIPNTIYSKNANIIRMLKREQLKFPLIVKDAFTHKGTFNFLAQNLDDIKKITSSNKGRRFIFQEFIPNNYDYRIVTFGYKAKFAFKRQRTKESGTHLNNTSQGGKATKIPLSKVNEKIIKDTEKACKALNRQIAGADILIDSKTKKHYFLEINYAPQLRTGSFAEEKMKLYADFLNNQINK